MTKIRLDMPRAVRIPVRMLLLARAFLRSGAIGVRAANAEAVAHDVRLHGGRFGA